MAGLASVGAIDARPGTSKEAGSMAVLRHRITAEQVVSPCRCLLLEIQTTQLKGELWRTKRRCRSLGTSW